MTVNSLIDLAIREIAQAYQPETLVWTKANRPNGWGIMLTMEERINKMALGGDIDGLREALNEYQGLILAMVREFKTIKEVKGQRMFKFK